MTPVQNTSRKFLRTNNWYVGFIKTVPNIKYNNKHIVLHLSTAVDSTLGAPGCNDVLTLPTPGVSQCAMDQAQDKVELSTQE